MSLFLSVINQLMTSRPGSSNDTFQEPLKSTEGPASWRSLFILMADKTKEFNVSNDHTKNLVAHLRKWTQTGWTGRLQLHLDIFQRNDLNMWLETVACWWPIEFLKTRHNKIDFLLTKPYCMCVCACVCVCLSGPRPVASQMGVCEEDYYCKPALPTHTVSKTYIHKTHFPRHPTPTLCSKRFEKKLEFYLE